MQIYKSEFVEVYFNDKLSLIEQKYLAKPLLDTNDLKKDLYHVLGVMKDLKPSKCLVDITFNEQSFNVNNQSLLQNEVIPLAVKEGLEKIAFIVNDDLNPSMQIEQIADKESKRIVVPQYFDDMEIARLWLEEK